jgi:hypothetical protein
MYDIVVALTCEMVHLGQQKFRPGRCRGNTGHAGGATMRSKLLDQLTWTESRAAANPSKDALHSPTLLTVSPTSLARSGEKPCCSQYLHTISKSEDALCTLQNNSSMFEIAVLVRLADSTAALTDSSSAAWVLRTRTILSRYASSKLRKDIVPREPNHFGEGVARNHFRMQRELVNACSATLAYLKQEPGTWPGLMA